MKRDTTTRSFRTPESIEFERVTHEMLPGFLELRGFGDVRANRERNGQTIVAKTPAGDRCKLRVRLCWRREGGGRDSPRARTFSAAQLLAKVKDDNWLGSLSEKVDRERSQGVTHFLFVQRDGDHIVTAALVPLSALVPIWIAQRDMSDLLIKPLKVTGRELPATSGE